MNKSTSALLAWLVTGYTLAAGSEPAGWWNAAWHYRTTVVRPSPDRDGAARPVEAAVDFPLLLQRAGVQGTFDPQSVRVVARGANGAARLVPFAQRSEWNAREGRRQPYLAWRAQPTVGKLAAYDIYFDTKDRKIEPLQFDPRLLPPENLLANPGFESASGNLPDRWQVTPRALVQLGRFAYTTGQRSLKIVVDQNTPPDAPREVTIAQQVDVRKFAGQEMVFACDLLAERAAYGAPVAIELEQYRADGSRILEGAVQPRWLTLELAPGQFVQLSQRGRFSPEAATVNVRIQLKCRVTDEDTGSRLAGPESYFTVWLDQVVLRPGERWPWPGASGAGFVAGALQDAPLNKAFAFTGLRRLAFNAASEGTLAAGRYDPDPRSVHWGLQAGTLEFWCRPTWNARDGKEHIFFEGIAYEQRLQSRLRKLGGAGGDQLEFTIADADGTPHTVRGPASLRAGHWHHLAATWDFPRAQLGLFVDGRPVAALGPHKQPWPFSLVAGPDGKHRGMGIEANDSRSLPMQAFLGGDFTCSPERSAEAALDEFRVSDVARYAGPFTPAGREFAVDKHTRALFHFENEQHGVHADGDRFVFGHLACELEPDRETAPLDAPEGGKIAAREVVVKPHASRALFEKNRAENRLLVYRPLTAPPDPRFVEWRPRQVERIVTGSDDAFVLEVGGAFEPLMQAITYEHADPLAGKTTRLAHWRANANVVPLSVHDLATTLAPHAKSDPEKAMAAFQYALATTNYYDADYAEFVPPNRRREVDYTLLKALNLYPCDQCGPLNHMLRKLFLAVGISSNNAAGTHHQFEQAFYQGDFRLFDLSPRLYWLKRDNEHVASRRDFENDLYLKLRQGTEVNMGLPGHVGGPSFGEAVRPHSMAFPLRPGERVSFAWHNEGRWFEAAGDRQGKPVPLAKIPPYFGNGVIRYEPVPGSPAACLENLRLDTAAGQPAVLRPRDPARAAALVYQGQCPYIFADAVVRGSYKAAKAQAIRLAVSYTRGKTWTPVWTSPGAAGVLDAGLGERVAGRYEYWLKLELAPGSEASVSGLVIRTTFVASPWALPGKLALGRNRIRFAGGPITAPLRTVCRWLERYRSDLGVSLNAISYYLNGDQSHRNLYLVRPGEDLRVRATLQGRPFSGKAALEGLPEGWAVRERLAPAEKAGGSRAIEFALRPGPAKAGTIRTAQLVLREGQACRRIGLQVLVADAPLVREAEAADEIAGAAARVPVAELSGAGGVAFRGQGHLGFDLSARQAGDYALWLRARWEPQSDTGLSLALDGGPARSLRATSIIGFTDWNDPGSAHTKMFAFFGEQYAHWSWYRIGGLRLAAGRHRLRLAAQRGAWFDALVALPQNPPLDRAAMNLFQNWNYAPWENPF